VTDPSAMVDTSYRSRGSIQLVVDGPAGCPRVLMPRAVGISMYTDGEVLFTSSLADALDQQGRADEIPYNV